MSVNEWDAETLYHTFTGLTSLEETLSVNIADILTEAVNNGDSYLSFNFRQGEGTGDRFWLAFNEGPEPTITTTVTPNHLSCLLFSQKHYLQIPPHDGHPCLRLTVGTINPRIGLSPTSKHPCWAHINKRPIMYVMGLFHKIQY